MTLQYYEKYAIKTPEKKEVPLSSKRRLRDFFPFVRSPILDVGCSKGYDTYFFHSHGYDIEGCDISTTAIRRAKKSFPTLHFFVHDFVREPYPTEKEYRTVLLFDVIEHIFDYNSFLQNIRDVLQEGGRLILTTPNVLGLKNRIDFIIGRGKYFKQMPHIRYFTPQTLVEVLEESGFRVLRTLGYSSVPFLPVSLRGSLTVIAEAYERAIF
jgi:2-polyprenyl-3-methyl-5-hydroxy-6-metoxy-1,4-benzoquinol methylase